MTQKELSYVEDAIAHEDILIKMLNETCKDLNDTDVIKFFDDEITIHEGKNHQVKNMFAAINHDVVKLKREKIGFFDLNGLKTGEYRRLTIKEVKKVYALSHE